MVQPTQIPKIVNFRKRSLLHKPGDGIVNDIKNFRRSKGSNADENGSLFDRPRRDRDLGFFWHSRKIKYTLNPITNYGEGSYREHGVQNKMAPWTFRILTPLIQNNLCSSNI